MNRLRWIPRTCVWTACFLLPAAAGAQNVEFFTLKQAVDRALLNSRDVTVAQLQYNVAKSTVEVDRAAFKPNLYTGSGAAYTYGFPQTPSGAAPSIVNLSYIQSLFNPLLTEQVRAAEQRSEVQRVELEKTRNAVTLQTISAYLELAKARHGLDLMRSERESNTRILNFTRARVAEGAELAIEVTKAQVAGAKTEYRVIQLESQQRNAEGRLSALMGVPSGERIEVESESLPFDENERDRDLTEQALANSLDLRQAELERTARANQLQGEIGTRWPTIDLFGEYGLFAKFNNFDQYFQKFQRNNFNVGVQIRIPLLTSQRNANVSLARSQFSVADAQVRSKRQNLELETSNKIQQLRELGAAREVARLELQEAQENLQLVQARFMEGKANLRDVDTARIDESEKWLAFLDSDYNRQKAQLDLLNATGTLGNLLH